MNDTPAHLTIGALALAAQVNVETIRYYQRQGLLSEPKKPCGGIRRYGELEIMRVRFIKSAQRLGFSLNEIGELLQLDGDLDCPKAQELAERKLVEIRERLSLLAQMETVLSTMVNACHTKRGNQSCPMISSLYGVPHPTASNHEVISSQLTQADGD